MDWKDVALKIVSSVIVVFLAVTLIFFLIRVVPGDPVRVVLGPEATQEMIEKYRHELGFDRPIMVQFVTFWQDLFRGRLGMSLMTKRDALQDVLTYLPASLELSLTAVLGFGFIGGILLGTIASLRKNKLLDVVPDLFAIAGISMPEFWSGMLLQTLFAATLGLLPSTGRIGVTVSSPIHITGLFVLDSLLTLNIPALVSSITHLILPTICLGLAPLSQTARVVRATMKDESLKDYVSQAKATGLPQRLIVYKYMLRNAISPAITMIGMSFGWALGFAFVVESIFAWPGMCRYAVDAVIQKDMAPVTAIAFVIILIYVIINIFVDIVHSILDPRIRYGGGA